MVNFGFSPVSTDPVSYYYNIENGLRMFRSVMAKLKAGQTIKPNVCCFGSSSLAGFGSTDNNILGFIGLLRSALATQFGDVGTGIITQDLQGLGANYYLGNPLQATVLVFQLRSTALACHYSQNKIQVMAVYQLL